MKNINVFKLLAFLSVVLISFVTNVNAAGFKECIYDHKEQDKYGVWQKGFADMAYYIVDINKPCPIPTKGPDGYVHVFESVKFSEKNNELLAITENNEKCLVKRFEIMHENSAVW